MDLNWNGSSQRREPESRQLVKAPALDLAAAVAVATASNSSNTAQHWQREGK